MSIVVYIAEVTGDEAQGYRAGFPDLPGVTAFGKATPDLLREARAPPGDRASTSWWSRT